MGTLTFSPSLYIGMAYFFLSQNFEFRYFWGFQKKWLLVGEPKSRILQNDKKIAPDFDTVEFLYTDSLNSARYGITV